METTTTLPPIVDAANYIHQQIQHQTITHTATPAKAVAWPWVFGLMVLVVTVFIVGLYVGRALQAQACQGHR